MNYSTLQEAYNVDTFEKKPRPSQKQKNGNVGSGNSGSGNAGNAGNVGSANTSPSFVESSKLASNASSCSPLQAPAYNIPISNDCKKEHADAMNVYLEGTDKPPQSASTSAMTGMLNLKGGNSSTSGDNVMPYYDEDLEQYFNISNLNDEVKYNSNSNSSNSNSYMPNSNKQSYTNNDTAEYTNNNAMVKHGNNLLNNSSYNLTPEEKKSAEEAIAYLKSIEEKITKNKNAIADPVATNANTGPGGFKTPVATPVATATPPPATTPEKSEKTDNYIYNAIFNISILLIIGIAIILLCDQMVELSIQIGMKRAVYILEPFIKTP